MDALISCFMITLIATTGEVIHVTLRRRACAPATHTIFLSWPTPPQLGWIGLGDIEISKKQTRADEINAAFEESKPLVATYCLPHHGSLNDWHKSLLNDFQTMPICVVSANGKYGHPQPPSDT